MANPELTVHVGISISDETVERCLRILEMWQDDNPDRHIQERWTEKSDGSGLHVEFSIVEDLQSGFWQEAAGGEDNG